MSKVTVMRPLVRRSDDEDGKLPPIAGLLIGGGISLMLWGVIIAAIFA